MFLPVACDDPGTGVTVNEPLVLSLDRDLGSDQCGPDIYPCPPYGTRRYQTVRDLPFLAVNAAAKALAGGADLAYFRHFHRLKEQGYKILLVAYTTGWCTHCRAQMEITPLMAAQYGAGSQNPRVAFLVVVRENPQLDPATVEYAAEYSAHYGLDAVVPVTNDQGNAFFPYMTSVGYPFNFFVRLDDMTILDYASAVETPQTFSAELDRVLQMVP
jgi:thiol-disulfide isomerase/thioredoxin